MRIILDTARLPTALSLKALACCLLLTTVLLTPPAAAQYSEGSFVMLRGSSGSINLEGPAVTGEDEEIEGEDIDGDGFRLEGRFGFGDHWFLDARIGSVSYEELDLDRSALGIGYRRVLREGSWSWKGAFIAAAERAETDGLESFQSDPRFNGLGDGQGGSENGLSLTFEALGTRGPWELRAFTRYINLGDGDGPSFGLGAGYAFSDRWTVNAGFEGTWVEDSDIGIDIAERHLFLGISRSF
ncbi:MAG: hypothetical protein AAGD01_02445 [Acidobacteriota bacterium]